VVGALPIINHFLELTGVDEALQRFLPQPGSRDRLPPAVGVGILLRNILVSREPLYSLRDWCRRVEGSLLGLPGSGAELLNDDRLGRCLDKLFEADRAALMTAAVVQAARSFELNLEELHNDSTTVTLSGEYVDAKGQRRNGKGRSPSFKCSECRRPTTSQGFRRCRANHESKIPGKSASRCAESRVDVVDVSK
jgi:hypothetical protein